MAVFRDPRQAVRVGPIRSARTYYVHYAEELNALYAHAGGNRTQVARLLDVSWPTVAKKIADYGIKVGD